MKQPSNKCKICLLCLGGLLILLGLLSLTFFWTLYSHIITTILAFGPNTELFKVWQQQQKTILDVYFFNWTNPEDIYNPNIKPKFVELGPYRYNVLKEKQNIKWNFENQTITYQYIEYFDFDEDNSPAHHSDVITTINMVALTAAHWASGWDTLLRQPVKLALLPSDIYVRKSMRELIFEGYKDPLLEAGKVIAMFSDAGVANMDHFCWLDHQNASSGAEGVYNMRTSSDNNFGAVKKWNYEDNTNFYEGHCGDVSGSAGEFYPTNLQPDHIKFYFSKMCRTMQLNFEKNTEVKGIAGYKYSLGAEQFDNGTIIKENACYCREKCMPSGVLDVSSCRKNAPVFVSSPHFYNADPLYVNSMEGLNPIKEKHEFYFTLEPNMGVILEGAGRLQLNVLLKSYSDFPLYRGVPEIMFPVFWSEQKGIIPDDIASNFALLLNLPHINMCISTVVILVGILITVSVVVYYANCIKQKNTKKVKKSTAEEVLLPNTKV